MNTETNDKKWLAQMQECPSTPGEVLADLLECSELNQGELARNIGVSRATISRIINGKQTLTPDMAIRLGRFWGNGARVWLALQQQVDEWELLHADKTAYEFIKPLLLAA